MSSWRAATDIVLPARAVPPQQVHRLTADEAHAEESEVLRHGTSADRLPIVSSNRAKSLTSGTLEAKVYAHTTRTRQLLSLIRRFNSVLEVGHDASSAPSLTRALPRVGVVARAQEPGCDSNSPQHTSSVEQGAMESDECDIRMTFARPGSSKQLQAYATLNNRVREGYDMVRRATGSER